MSSNSNDADERGNLSKVTFSPISSELMVVKIRPMSTEVREEVIPRMSSDCPPAPPKTTHRKKDKHHSRSTMTDSQKTASSSSQTSHKEKKGSEIGSKSDYTPCLRHAAENISRKAIDVPSEKISLCNNCSKSMLSYIFLVQDFLDSLALEIRGGETPGCLQCARQEVRNNVATSDGKHKESSRIESAPGMHSENKYNRSNSEQKDVSGTHHGSKKTTRERRTGHHSDSKRNEVHQKGAVGTSHHPSHEKQEHHHQHHHQQHSDFVYHVTPPPNTAQDHKPQHSSNLDEEKRVIAERSNFEGQPSNEQQQNVSNESFNQQWTDNKIIEQRGSQEGQGLSFIDYQNNNQTGSESDRMKNESTQQVSTNRDHSSSHSYESNTSTPTGGHPSERPLFRSPMERMQPSYDTPVPGSSDDQQKSTNNFPVQSPTVFRDDVDGIISTLSNVEREIYDSARNRAGWEGFTEPQEKFSLPPSSNVITNEAFVTSCRNNAEAIGCLVVGTSLLLCRTSRTLCVLVSDGVSTAFRNALSSVFKVVQYTRSLDSLGTTKLALLEQPELGITFEKLNIWRLTQFTKCIYLNPDTLVIQNCDELFDREELSAVPDIGWPDCFNSGVFVFSPSVDTFWKFMEFSEKQGSYDGGDQGLLNSYFSSWSSDINKKLSFIYNLMANVSYTYTPAFRQFGRDVKIVQFHGSYKPWHVKFFSKTGQISPSSPVHPTYLQFVHIWLSIFRISVLRLLPQNIQSYAASEETICAVETLRFFPLPAESEAEFFLTPPSVRLRLVERRLNRSTSLPISEARRRKSAEFSRYIGTDDDVVPEQTEEKEEKVTEEPQKVLETDATAADDKLEEKLGEKEALETEEISDGKEEVKVTRKKRVIDENTLPGAEVGDYQGMKAWEQGRMDYQGDDSSDNVIKRLQFLMTRPK